MKAALGGVAAALGVPGTRSGAAHAQSTVAQLSDGVAELRDGLYVVTTGGTNIVALTGVEGTLLVDGGAAEQAASLLATLATLPGGGAVHTLFNTCWHRSQTGLNERLGAAGATIIAHENARLWLSTDVTWPWDGSRFEPMPAAARPNKTFYARESLTVAQRVVEYGHLRACPHTDGDTYVHFRDANVVAVGNAIAGGAWPWIDWWTGGWLGGIVGALELLREIADDETLIVPARGAALRRPDIVAQHEAFDLIYERLVGLLYGGKSPDEAVAARPLAEFEPQFGPSDDFVRRAFQSLWGYLTPDA